MQMIRWATQMLLISYGPRMKKLFCAYSSTVPVDYYSVLVIVQSDWQSTNVLHTPSLPYCPPCKKTAILTLIMHQTTFSAKD